MVDNGNTVNGVSGERLKGFVRPNGLEAGVAGA